MISLKQITHLKRKPDWFRILRLMFGNLKIRHSILFFCSFQTHERDFFKIVLAKKIWQCCLKCSVYTVLRSAGCRLWHFKCASIREVSLLEKHLSAQALIWSLFSFRIVKINEIRPNRNTTKRTVIDAMDTFLYTVGNEHFSPLAEKNFKYLPKDVLPIQSI